MTSRSFVSSYFTIDGVTMFYAVMFLHTVHRLSLKQRMGNPGIGESGNRGIRESGNPERIRRGY